MVVEVLVPHGDPEDALAQQALKAVIAALVATVVGENLGDSTQQAQASLRLPQKDGSTAVAGDIAASELGLHDSATNAWKRELENGTIWHGEASF